MAPREGAPLLWPRAGLRKTGAIALSAGKIGQTLLVRSSTRRPGGSAITGVCRLPVSTGGDRGRGAVVVRHEAATPPHLMSTATPARRWRSNGPANVGTAPQPGDCANNCAARPAGVHVILVSAGWATPATPMTPCSGSPDRDRSRADQATSRRFPARRSQAGAFRGQDPDHARPYRGGEVPRLRITVNHNDRKVTRGRRSANGVVGLYKIWHGTGARQPRSYPDHSRTGRYC